MIGSLAVAGITILHIARAVSTPEHKELLVQIKKQDDLYRPINDSLMHDINEWQESLNQKITADPRQERLHTIAAKRERLWQTDVFPYGFALVLLVVIGAVWLGIVAGGIMLYHHHKQPRPA